MIGGVDVNYCRLALTTTMTLQDLQPQLLALSPSEKAQAIQLLTHSLSTAGTGIEKTPEVCGWDACITNTRIPVWVLVQAHNLGNTDTELLLNYPSLGSEDLRNAWNYASENLDEINRAIQENEEA
jgi:uncharacterized protein (DUF433 family)